MLRWVSGGVLRYAIVLSLGWISLAGVIAIASGSTLRAFDDRTDQDPLEKAIWLDEPDPCTNDPLFVNAQMTIVSHALTVGSLLAIDGTLMLTGSAEIGASHTPHRVTIQQRFTAKRSAVTGPVEPIDVGMALVDRPYPPETILRARLDGEWDGSEAAFRVTRLYLDCA
jgi:hypothetical protein